MHMCVLHCLLIGIHILTDIHNSSCSELKVQTGKKSKRTKEVHQKIYYKFFVIYNVIWPLYKFLKKKYNKFFELEQTQKIYYVFFCKNTYFGHYVYIDYIYEFEKKK